MKEIIDRIKAYTERYGIVKLCGKIVEKGTGYVRNIGKTETEKQIHEEYTFARNPLISIIVPVYDVEHEAFKATLESVLAQTYGNWELCIADGGENKVDTVIDEVMGDDARIRYVSLEANLGISGNSNQALEVASGEYVAFLDHDDILEPDALYEAANRIVNYGADMVYTDEDKVSPDLKHYFKPYRKPDYNKTLLLSNNYICHFCVINREIVTEAGGFRSKYDGAQDYDLILRCVDKYKVIEHVDKILYHWKSGENSTSGNPFNKQYAFDAGRRALNEYTGDGTVVCELDDPGYYRVNLIDVPDVQCVTSYPSYDGKDEDIRAVQADYVILLRTDMKLSNDFAKLAVSRAVLTDADIIVPKITAGGRYLYNGIARTGHGYTRSLKGSPAWFKGDFNMAAVDMETAVVPRYGIMVKKSALDKVLDSGDRNLYAHKGSTKGLKMVYAPEITVKM